MLNQLIITFILLTSLTGKDLIKCEDEGPFYLKFLPKNYGNVMIKDTLTISGRCFKSMKIELTETDSSFKLNYNIKTKESWTCTEFLLATSGKTLKHHLAVLPGRYHLEWSKKGISKAETDYIRKRGIRVLLSCDSISNWPKDLLMSLEMFIGGNTMHPHLPIIGSHIPQYMAKANANFIKGYTGHEWKKRANPIRLDIDKREIQSGTALFLLRLDGVQQLIHIGSGSRAGHTVIALWDRQENELYIVESKDGSYWPKHGIQKTRWEDWMNLIDQSDIAVVMLPLKEEYQNRFDEDKAWQFFNQLEGTAYGFHNFLFGWIDDTQKNLPDLIDLNFIVNVLQVIELASPSVAHTLFLNAFNKRLGTTHKTISALWEEIYERDTSLEELAMIVEKEEWVYDDGHNYTCSAFATAIYKRAGLFGDLIIESTEFTPKDVYELALYDLSKDKLPKGCEGYSPRGYCQLIGKIDLDLGKVNFVKPYSHMNENCPTLPPLYERTEGC